MLKVNRVVLTCLPATLIALAYAGPALAHAAHDENSFYTGFMHPIHGLDHLLAMVAVGLLSARMEAKRMWTLPAAFVVMMGLGGLLGTVWGSEGIAAFEWGIMLSVLIFGLAVALAPKIPVIAGNAIVAVFAICHGHAHVAEMGSASAWGYFPGMLIATGLLHVLGLFIGIGLNRGVGDWAIRAAGGAIAGFFAIVMILDIM